VLFLLPQLIVIANLAKTGEALREGGRLGSAAAPVNQDDKNWAGLFARQAGKQVASRPPNSFRVGTAIFLSLPPNQ